MAEGAEQIGEGKIVAGIVDPSADGLEVSGYRAGRGRPVRGMPRERGHDELRQEEGRLGAQRPQRRYAPQVGLAKVLD